MRDDLLRRLAIKAEDLADKNEGNSEIAIILSIKGNLVSGFIISPKIFMQLFFSGPAAKISLQDYMLLALTSDDFIHLRNAQFSTLGQIPSPDEHGILWRGKLDEIDGFSLLPLSESPTA